MAEVLPDRDTFIYTNSGRTAFEIAVRQENLSHSRVILPAFICEEAFRPIFEKYDIEPIFVDINREKFAVKKDEVLEEINRADALLLVHPFGEPADVEFFSRICEENNTVLIEDCARSLGSSRDGRKVGSTGKYAFYSLYKTSPIIRGGLLVTDEEIETVIKEDLKTQRFELMDLIFLVPKTLQTDLYEIFRKLNFIPGIKDFEEIKEEFDRFQKLKQVNTKFFKYYIEYLWEKEKTANRYKVEKLEKSTEKIEEIELRDREGEQAFYSYPVLAEKSDELQNYLREQGFELHRIWKEPYAESESKEFEKQFPETEYVSRKILQFQIDRMSKREVRKLTKEIEKFYPR